MFFKVVMIHPSHGLLSIKLFKINCRMSEMQYTTATSPIFHPLHQFGSVKVMQLTRQLRRNLITVGAA
jgi:hypothetical protein